MIESSTTETCPSYSKEAIIKLCQEIYQTGDLITNRSPQIDSDNGLRSWLESFAIGSIPQCTNLDLLLRFLSANLPESVLKKKITRWLNQNLPSY
jgi:hypothetical protein